MPMTIYEIAERSGVSTATVSRVLNDSEKVSEKTRRKVMEIINQEHYVPNAFARGLGLNTMKMVGILCTDVADMYYAKAVSLLQKSLSGQGRDTLLSCTGTKFSQKKKSLDMLLEKRVDAVILVGSALQEMDSNDHIAAVAKEIPVIIINGYVELPGVVCVLCDEKQAMQQNVMYLHVDGYRRILYLYDAMTYSGVQKKDGYHRGCEICGIAQEDRLELKVGSTVQEVMESVTRLLDDGISFDAVLASEDRLALSAQKALQARGRQVPIIGFNNSILAEFSTPTLSSVDNMLDTLCATAIHLLGDVFDGKAVPDKIIISGSLVERETFTRQAPACEYRKRY